jgi:MYXO-CTERM domain-containing protein
LWIGYTYTTDLVTMWAQIDNYNFWLRKFTYDPTSGGSWANPKNVTNIADKRINVREPRIFGTPASNTAAGFCDGTPTQDATFCQNRNVVYLMWGTQENVSPFDLDGGDDLGVYATVSLDGGNTFAAPIRYSEEMGSLFDDDESAFETQPVTRPDGTRFYGVFNTENAIAKTSAANYRSGDVAEVADPVTPPATGGGGGGCAIASGDKPFDPVLPALAALGLIGLGLRRLRRN